VEGKWYYLLEGEFSFALTHDDLDGIFTYDINGVQGGDANTTDAYRYATINGVHLALPTANGGLALPRPLNEFGQTEWQPNTNYTDYDPEGSTWDRGFYYPGPSNNTTSSYNEFLAIWDAHNGEAGNWGVPNGWDFTRVAGQLPGGLWLRTSTRGGSVGGEERHIAVDLQTGNVFDMSDTRTEFCRVALQVL
jgi:hypothetical protein